MTCSSICGLSGAGVTPRSRCPALDGLLIEYSEVGPGVADEIVTKPVLISRPVGVTSPAPIRTTISPYTLR